jgi:hypothetical protein
MKPSDARFAACASFVNSREFAPRIAPNREESALLRALLAPGGADEAGIARGCPASLCTAT